MQMLILIALLAACRNAPPTDDTAGTDLGTDWDVTEADCPPGGNVTIDRLGDPLSVTLCEGTACGPVDYDLQATTLTVWCGPNPGHISVLWGLRL